MFILSLLQLFILFLSTALLPFSLLWIGFLAFFIHKQAGRKINYLLLALNILLIILTVSSTYCLMDMDDLGQCSFFGANLTKDDDVIFILPQVSSLLFVFLTFVLHFRLFQTKIISLFKKHHTNSF